MKINKKVIGAATLGTVILSVVGLSVSAAFAVPPATTGSDNPFYLSSAATGLALTAGSTVLFDDDVAGNPDSNNSTFTEAFTAPAGTTQTFAFVSPRGSEKTKSAWNAYTGAGALTPAVSLYNLLTNSTNTPGSANGVKAAGGPYSLGVAFLNNTGTVLGADFTFIDVTAGTGAYTFATPVVVGPPPPTTQTFNQPLQVTTTAAADGALSLVAPSVTPTIIGSPVLSGGTFGLSVSTGSLGQLYVQDDRYLTHKGWTLTANVADFAGPISVSKVQLGVKPVLVAAGTTSAGVTAGAEQVAGSAVYPMTFAAAANNVAVGRTNFNADLRFVAPAAAPAGTYTSTLTLTVIPAP